MRLKRSTTTLGFDALTIEGGLFSADAFSRIARLDPELQADADYRIPKGLKLRDEIARAWHIAQALRVEFCKERARTDRNAITVTRAFVEALLQQVLGFHRWKPALPLNVRAAASRSHASARTACPSSSPRTR
jgi:hypothetical protein